MPTAQLPAQCHSTKLYGLWYGGNNYRVPSNQDRRDIEEFTSLRAAIDEFRERLHNYSGRFPCVGQDAEMHLFYTDPFCQDVYPDKIIRIGTRGGIRVERI